MEITVSDAAKKMQDQLQLLLGTVISVSMEKEYHAEWFEKLREFSKNNAKRGNEEIVKYNWQSIDDFDFQALLKALAFLPECFNAVAKCYGITKPQDQKNVGGVIRELMWYRNGKSAHRSIADIRNEQENPEVSEPFDHKRAMQTMLVLGQCFANVTSDTGKCYYQEMQKIHTDFLRQERDSEQAALQNTNRKMRNLLIIFLALILLLLALLGFFITHRQANEDTSHNTNAPIETQGQTTPIQNSTAASTTTTSEPTVPPATDKLVGSATIRGLTFSVDQEKSPVIQLHYTNEGNAFSLGWASQANVVAETSEGTYYTQSEESSMRILAGDSGTIRIVFDKLPGTVKTITVKNILILNDRGLPSTSSRSGGEELTIELE